MGRQRRYLLQIWYADGHWTYKRNATQTPTFAKLQDGGGTNLKWQEKLQQGVWENTAVFPTVAIFPAAVKPRDSAASTRTLSQTKCLPTSVVIGRDYHSSLHRHETQPVCVRSVDESIHRDDNERWRRRNWCPHALRFRLRPSFYYTTFITCSPGG